MSDPKTIASESPAGESAASSKPLRVWPGVVIAALVILLRYVMPLVAPGASMYAVMAGAIGGLLVAIWWLFFSRAPWLERIVVLLLIVIALLGTRRIVHPSIAGGMMGMMLSIYAIPVLSIALVAAAVITRGRSAAARRASIAAAVVLGCGVFALLRTGGLTGQGNSDLHWRWTKTPEQRLLEQERGSEPKRVAAAAKSPAGAEGGGAAARKAQWPGFRGPERDSVVRGTRIATDWSRSGPVEVWRRPIGPGWSSFAVDGDFIYTQEQRGDDEVVSCYQLATGAPVWSHSDAARFYESNGGAGPRATPTLSHGRVYAMGATGILNALDARTGSVIWSRNAAADTSKKLPGWGFASSPLVIGDRVVVATAGVLAGYDAATGEPRWVGPKDGFGYSSPHLAAIHGVPQIVLLNGAGAIGVAPADGEVLWRHEWKSDGIVQPTVMAGGDVLLGSGSGLGVKVGLRRVALAKGPAGWTAEERWTSPALKPYFNDFVVHAGNAYGFDGTTLACVDIADGARRWKGGRYGNGQLVLLADQDLLLVLSEKGEVALVGATGDEFRELARFAAIKGKTWNHPVVVENMLLVRNGEEMAAFRLP